MPASMAGLADGAHVVQFYADDALLIDGVARLVGTALVAGDAAVVIATEAHESAIRRRLHDRGLDVQVAIRQGRYLSLNAREIVRRIVEDDVLDADAFRTNVGGTIAAARDASESDPQRVVVFGESVSLLMRDGAFQVALELEKVWNDLQKSEPFALCCGYGMDLFRGGNRAAAFLHICSQHSQIFPAERRRAFSRVTRATAADHH